MDSNAPYITNLVNSIIGVSVLAMPFCMKKCGLLLGLSLLIGMSWLTYISCHMLVQSAVHKRRRTYEYLAFYTLGPTGKFAVELSMIGLMLGTCCAFYVIIGDLATQILSGFVAADPIQLRTYVIVFCGLCIALPLGLMKNLSVLGFIGFFSVIFYALFVCVMLANSISSGLLSFEWIHKVELFRPAGVFQCLPIFGLAYACQCQLFVVYDSLEDATLMRMEKIVSNSLKIVTSVYCMVAILGYQLFLDEVQGNVLKNFSPNAILSLIKLGFAVSVVVGFPLMIFPCRQSIHTLFFSAHPKDGIPTKTYIEPFTFKAITLGIVLTTMMVAVFIPNVETILGLTGATMGSFICFIFPGVIFSKASPKGDTNVSRFVLGIGCILLVVCTYSNVHSAISQSTTSPNHPVAVEINPPVNGHDSPVVKAELPMAEKRDGDQPLPEPTKPPVAEAINHEHRHEPANPLPPVVMSPEDEEDPVADKSHDVLLNNKEEGLRENKGNEVKIIKEVDPSEKIIPKVVEANHQYNEKPSQQKLEINPLDNKLNHENKEAPSVLKEVNIAAQGEAAASIKTKDEEMKEKQEVHNPLKSDETAINEDELLDKIKEQHRKQHELLDKQEKLIQALEHHNKDHDGEKSHELGDQEEKGNGEKSQDSIAKVVEEVKEIPKVIIPVKPNIANHDQHDVEQAPAVQPMENVIISEHKNDIYHGQDAHHQGAQANQVDKDAQKREVMDEKRNSRDLNAAHVQNDQKGNVLPEIVDKISNEETIKKEFGKLDETKLKPHPDKNDQVEELKVGESDKEDNVKAKKAKGDDTLEKKPKARDLKSVE